VMLCREWAEDHWEAVGMIASIRLCPEACGKSGRVLR
jgi:hypothetical protein